MKNQISVFLIEDDQHDQFFFTLAIKEIANAILFHIANNGKEALNKLNEPGVLPDLIFTDIHMPVMGGIECLSEIKKNPQIRNIPVIVLSSDTSIIEVIHKMGAKAFIKKPNEYGMLQTKIEQVINMDFNRGAFVAN